MKKVTHRLADKTLLNKLECLKYKFGQSVFDNFKTTQTTYFDLLNRYLKLNSLSKVGPIHEDLCLSNIIFDTDLNLIRPINP